MAAAQNTEKLITVARVGAPHGVKGDLKLHVFTESADILSFKHWYIFLNNDWQPLSKFSIKPLGNQYVIHFHECQDRDIAKRYVNAELAIPRKDLSELDEGYYWADLEGLKVVNTQGIEFGIVDHLVETGANDILVVKGETERLVPYLKHVVQEVDLAQGMIIVEWDADF